MTDDLATWLLEQIAEDERAVADLMEPERVELLVSRRALHHSIVEDRDPHGAARFRLAECDAKRRIIALHSTPHTVVDGFCTEEGGACTHAGESECAACGQQPCDTLRLLAPPYADRPGYRSEWAL